MLPVVLNPDPVIARRVGRKGIGSYLKLTNYANNWRRLGFADDDLVQPGSDRLIDALLAHGSAADIAARLTEHFDAGADHVVVQVLARGDRLLATLTELAGPLGLKS